MRTLRIRRLVITTCRQASGAPLIDDCFCRVHSGPGCGWLRVPRWLAPWGDFRATGRAILLRPWRRTRHGERPRMTALVAAWITGPDLQIDPSPHIGATLPATKGEASNRAC